MKQLIFKTEDEASPLILRLMAALVLFPHGAQKLLGWFGGHGFEGTMQFFTGTAGLPWIIGFLTILAEFFGPVLLVLGLGTRLVAASLFIVFTGVIFANNIQFGFFMNWFNNQKGEGIEFSLLMLAIYAALVVSGSGKWSIDRKII